MPEFSSNRSIRVLGELSPGLVAVNEKAIQHIDYSLFYGKRSLTQQQTEFNANRSHIDGVHEYSKHQVFTEQDIVEISNILGHAPDLTEFQLDQWAHAFDFVPAPLPGNDWENRPLFTAYAHFFIGIGFEKGVELTSGMDWDGDFQWRDQTFHDYPHIEERING